MICAGEMAQRTEMLPAKSQKTPGNFMLITISTNSINKTKQKTSFRLR